MTGARALVGIVAQLTEWLARANIRQHRRLQCRPIDRWDADRAAMLALPPVDPVVGWRVTIRLPRDHYVRLDSNDYSVHPSAIGRRVEINAGLEHVMVTLAGAVVARHERCWADHQSITDPVHAAAAAELRQVRRLVAAAPADTTVEHPAWTTTTGCSASPTTTPPAPPVAKESRDGHESQ